MNLRFGVVGGALLGSIVALTARPIRADAVLEGFDDPLRIPGQYIVVLKSDKTLGWVEHRGLQSKAARDAAHASNKARIEAVGREVLGSQGALGKTFTVSIKGFSAYLAEGAAKGLARDSRIERIVSVKRTWTTAVQQNAPWHLDRIDQENLPLNHLYNYFSTGAFSIPNPQHLSLVRVFIIDSGVRTTHNEFGGRVADNIDFQGSANGDTFSGNPCNRHGTLVAGVLGGATYGVAKGVLMTPLRITDCNGNGNTADMVQGIDWATEWTEDFGVNGEFQPFVNGVRYYRPVVINMSVITGQDSLVQNAINRALAAGAIFVGGAGNHGDDACQHLPGSIANVINVGGTEISSPLFGDDRDRVWIDVNTSSGSDYGTCVDIFAPAEDVRSSDNGSNSDTAVEMGTSLAAPQVAGVAVLYVASNPTATPAQVQTAIVNAAVTGKIQGNLNGSPNRLLSTAVPGNLIPGGGSGDDPSGLTPAVKAAVQVVIDTLLLE